LLEGITGSEESPIGDCAFRKVDIFRGVGDAMKIIRVEFIGGDEKTSGFLKYSPYRHGVERSIVLALVDVEA
jgi:hypothetical protein